MVGNAKTFLSTSKLKININLLQSLWFVVIASKRQILVIFLGFAMRCTVHVVTLFTVYSFFLNKYIRKTPTMID